MKKYVLFLLISLFCLNIYADKPRILVGSPVRQKPAILQEFLESLRQVESDNYTLDYCFIDDNDDPQSSNALRTFSSVGPARYYIIQPEKEAIEYVCDENTHHWKDALVWRVAHFKDEIIDLAKTQNYDYLFLIDSDLVLHPKTIDQLLAANKDIVSNIFWTSWQPNSIEQPQVWLSDHYTQYEQKSGEVLSEVEKKTRFHAFLEKMRKPGTYEVGGLGACTLISREALERGVSFKKLKNLTMWGEDRHFCVRAIALGLSLFVDTHYPAYHIYRESYLEGVAAFKNQSVSKPRLTLAMIMKDEADRYLKPVLEAARKYITDAVIIDDGSSDHSIEMCETILKDIPLTLIRNEESKFSNEVVLRQQLWDAAVKTNPDWILILDADEIFEDRFKDQVADLLLDEEVDIYCFRLYDFWDDNNYREDDMWCAHLRYAPFLMRYDSTKAYHFINTPQHCGRFPLVGLQLKWKCSDLRLKHYGWAQYEDRVAKLQRYQLLDPGAKYGSQKQYDSILDENPNLVAWQE